MILLKCRSMDQSQGLTSILVEDKNIYEILHILESSPRVKSYTINIEGQFLTETELDSMFKGFTIQNGGKAIGVGK